MSDIPDRAKGGPEERIWGGGRVIAPLLEALREKDAASWEKIARGIPLQPRGQYMTYDRGEVTAHQCHEMYIPFGELLPEVACAWLQSVLQEAISSRGWDFTISTLKYKNRCIARIDMIEENKTVQYGDSPAETLLRCYLEAIIC
jgi:hypothetical protein